jgi:hypothetical protein
MRSILTESQAGQTTASFGPPDSSLMLLCELLARRVKAIGPAVCAGSDGLLLFFPVVGRYRWGGSHFHPMASARGFKPDDAAIAPVMPDHPQDWLLICEALVAFAGNPRNRDSREKRAYELMNRSPTSRGSRRASASARSTIAGPERVALAHGRGPQASPSPWISRASGPPASCRVPAGPDFHQKPGNRNHHRPMPLGRRSHSRTRPGSTIH